MTRGQGRERIEQILYLHWPVPGGVRRRTWPVSGYSILAGGEAGQQTAAIASQ